MAQNEALVAGLAIAGVLAGCNGTGRLPPVSARAEAVLDPCDDFYCGNNSPIVVGGPFWDLDAGGQPNSAGLSILPGGFRDANGKLMTIDIDRDVLRGNRNGKLVQSADLIGATLHLAHANDNFTYYLLLRAIGETPFRVAPASNRNVQTYSFVYYREDQDPIEAKDLCPATSDSDPPDISGHAVIFRGDQYDKDLKTVTELGFDTSWFNISCAGTAIAKLHLMRHTLASADADHFAKVPQRQALLKMFVADYCNTGRPFTVRGIDLRFQWQQDWQEEHGFDESNQVPEAVWTERGAVCLSHPRMLGVPDRGYGTVTTSEIAAECDPIGLTLPPTCDGVYSDWKSQGYIISATPRVVP
jgi:hypothetical protein